MFKYLQVILTTDHIWLKNIIHNPLQKFYIFRKKPMLN